LKKKNLQGSHTKISQSHKTLIPIKGLSFSVRGNGFLLNIEHFEKQVASITVLEQMVFLVIFGRAHTNILVIKCLIIS
jgi:hypothetical protein